MSKTIYKDFDLPTKHLDGEQHFAPSRARDSGEIERRRQQPSGTLLAETEHRGIARASFIIPRLSETPSINFAAETLAAAGLNTAWYLFGRNAPVMRRRLKLEVLATADPEQRPTTLMLLDNAAQDLRDATDLSAELVEATRGGQTGKLGALKSELGRKVGHGALTLSCVPLGDQIGYESSQLSDADVQMVARQRALHSLEQGRVLEEKMGVPPSMGGLGDQLSELSFYWLRNAPDQALDEFHMAHHVIR